jgi:hypothetical protein
VNGEVPAVTVAVRVSEMPGSIVEWVAEAVRDGGELPVTVTLAEVARAPEASVISTSIVFAPTVVTDQVSVAEVPTWVPSAVQM